MDFGALLSHIATTQLQFRAGLKDADGPALPSPTEKDAVVKFLGDSFDYCSCCHLRDLGKQLGKVHNSRWKAPGREILLAMYIMSRITAARRKSICATKGQAASLQI